jgi:hypothetical protein
MAMATLIFPADAAVLRAAVEPAWSFMRSQIHGWEHGTP